MAISTTFTLKFNGAAVERGLRKAQEAAMDLSKATLKIGLAGAALGATAALAGFVAFVKGSSEAAASMEDLTVQFETLTKSAEITKKILSEMKDDAAKSPLSISDYAQAGKTLMAFGMEAESVMPTLRSLADISMGNADRFGSLALAFAQTQAAGRLMGQEVLQFINAGFNPLQQISKRTGESMAQLKKRMEDGAISSKEVAQAFKEATAEGGLFYKAIEKGAAATTGKIAKAKDAILSLKIAFGTGFNDGLRSALDAVNQNIPKLEAKFSEMGSMLGMAITDAVSGDYQRFVMIGELIGTAVKEGVKVSVSAIGGELTQGVLDFAQNELKYSPGGIILRAGDAAERHRLGNKQSNRQNLQSAFSNIGEKYEALQGMGKRGNVPGVEGWRYAKPNEPATMMDGERVVRILESIDRRLAPQP